MNGDLKAAIQKFGWAHVEVPWISVEEQLPPFNREVLTYSPDMAMHITVDIYDGYYGEDDEEWYEGWTWRKTGITHWAPMPEPPKEG